jgi:hypothetical protein
MLHLAQRRQRRLKTEANTDAEALAVRAARIARHRVQPAPPLAALIGRLGPG